MKTRVLERAKSNLLLLCASIVTVKNMVLNSYKKEIVTVLIFRKVLVCKMSSIAHFT